MAAALFSLKGPATNIADSQGSLPGVQPVCGRPGKKEKPMHRSPVTLDALNAMDRTAFVAAIGFAFEDSPWVAEATWPGRPFGSLDALHEAMCAVVVGAGPERQLALLRAHPDLAGRVALAGTLGPESASEQQAAGLGSLSADEIALFGRYNEAYRERFGFPFVICARENKKESILAGFGARLGNTPTQEIATALGEVAKIARLRLHDALV